MPVGAAAGHEREEFRERGEPVRVLGRMPRVSNLQAIESQSDVPFDRLTSTVRTRVRDDGEATAGMNERDGVANGQLVLGNERGFASAQVAIEGVARVACPAAVDEHAGEVWATDRRVTSTSQDILERDRNSQRVELLHDLDCTCVAPLAKRPERLLDGALPLNVQTEQVNFALIVGGAQLDTWHDTNPEGVRRSDRLGNAVHRVVIGERDGGEPRRLRRGNHRRRRFGTIGRCRVRVQVDMRPFRPADAGRCSAHFV